MILDCNKIKSNAKWNSVIYTYMYVIIGLGNLLPYSRGFFLGGWGWRGTNLADLDLEGIHLILADIYFLVNLFPFIKNLLSVNFE